MTDAGDPDQNLKRIADALERIAPPPASTDWTAAPAYYWSPTAVRAIAELAAKPLDLLTGIDAQKAAMLDNARRHAQGLPAHDVLLWGARGMGKSALVASVVDALGREGTPLALVQTSTLDPSALAGLFETLAGVDRRFLLFIDDIAFDDEGAGHAMPGGARLLRSLLEGGTVARPGNVRLAVTSNRRNIVERHMSEQDDPVNPRDALDDRLALADRFGLSLGFHACSQDEYLAIVAGYAEAHGMAFDRDDALLWARQRGHRSGRIAWHYVVELAGRAGKRLG